MLTVINTNDLRPGEVHAPFASHEDATRALGHGEEVCRTLTWTFTAPPDAGWAIVDRHATVEQQLRGSPTVIEWYLEPDWYQARPLARAVSWGLQGPIVRYEMRWRHKHARSWSSWGQPWGDRDQHLRALARRAAFADLDPSTRGPIGGAP